MTYIGPHASGRSLKWACIAGLTALLPAAVLCQTFLLSRNTLDNNGRWISGKARIGTTLMGAKTYMRTSQALAKGRLNLGAWHGFQELVYKDELDIRDVRFDFWIEEGGYFAFISHKDEDSFSGVRLSVNEAFESVCFNARADGKFLERSKLGAGDLAPGKWHRLELSTAPDGPAFTVDGTPIALGAVSLPPPNATGFRGSAKRVLIDNVVVNQNHGAECIVERFSNRKNRPLVLASSLLIVLLMDACLWVLGRLRRAGRLNIMLSLTTLNAVSAVLAAMVFACVFLFQERYPEIRAQTRNEWLQWEVAQQTKGIREEHPVKSGDGSFRILFVGTSQTWGEGAAKEEERFVNIIERRLNEVADGGPCFDCINAGIKGGQSGTLLGLYEEEWIDLNPRVVVVNLGNNDKSAMQFVANLRRFAELGRQHAIRTVFVTEPNCIERTPGELELHTIMRSIGKECHVQVIEMHEHLKRQYDTGFVWWDKVHPTSYGHSLIADCLFEALALNDRAIEGK